MPADGSIMSGHIGTGPLWGFFAASVPVSCILVMLATSDIILSLIQGIGTQI